MNRFGGIDILVNNAGRGHLLDASSLSVAAERIADYDATPAHDDAA